MCHEIRLIVPTTKCRKEIVSIELCETYWQLCLSTMWCGNYVIFTYFDNNKKPIVRTEQPINFVVNYNSVKCLPSFVGKYKRDSERML